MRVVSQLTMLGLLFVGAVGCEIEDPCDEFVEYMCECHDGGDVSCEELQTTLLGADADVQDECAIALADQEAMDAANPDFDCFESEATSASGSSEP